MPFFALLDDTSNDAAIGMFDGINDGGVATIGTATFNLSYHAGTGNDISLGQPQDPPAFTSDGTDTFVEGIAHTFTIVATGTPAAQITFAGQLPGGLGFHDNGNGTAAINGIPDAGTANTYLLTFTAHNGVGQDASQNFTLTVYAPAKITSNDHDTWMVGVAHSFPVTTTGTPTPSLSYTGDLPEGVFFTHNGDGTATIAGNPAVGTGGTHTISIVSHNGAGNDATKVFTLTVNEAPQIKTTAGTLMVGQTGSVAIVTTGFPRPNLTESPLDTLPTGVTFNPATGLLSGKPALGKGHVYTLHFTATNSIGSDASGAVKLTVSEKPFVFTQPQSKTVVAGNKVVFTAAAFGFPVPTVQWQVSTKPGMFKNIPGATAKTLTVTTTAALDGARYRAVFQNAFGQAISANAVLAVNYAPLITSQPVSRTAHVGQTAKFTVVYRSNPAATVQWQVSTDGGHAFHNIPKEKSATLSFKVAKSDNKTFYRAVVKNKIGTTISKVVELKI